MKRPPKWMKSKGYIHLTPSLNIQKHWEKYLQQIKNPNYVSRYAFYPLIHRSIDNRRYKKPDPEKHLSKKRAHTHVNKKTGKTKRSIKRRPLHYASHFDFLIYAYYGNILKDKYEKILKSNPLLNESILAYRSVPISKTDDRGKSNIHFAKEAFDAIQKHYDENGNTAVLTLDLKSFFSSLSHSFLYQAWAKILETDKLPAAHLNVFKACTNFSYVLFDDFRNSNGNFDESELAAMRKKHGVKAFFTSNKELRKAIKQGELRIFKNPFRKINKKGFKEVTGIPQGLAISAILSNIYLLEFDKKVISKWVIPQKIIYRRYSDDILIICSPKEMDTIYQKIQRLLEEYKVELSTEKTEQFIFKNLPFNSSGDRRLTSIKIEKNKCIIGTPLTYLGFEYRGYNVLIKSANLAKYYRRLIQTIKRRARRAKMLSERDPTIPRAVYLNQVKKIYNAPLKHAKHQEKKQTMRSRYKLVLNDRGDFEFRFEELPSRSSNYITYIRKCDEIFETSAFSKQLRRKRQIIGQAVNKHLGEFSS